MTLAEWKNDFKGFVKSLSISRDDYKEIMEYIDDVPVPHEIRYDDCANALLKMWMDNVLTDGEYYRIADKLNEKWGKIEISESYNKETT